MTDSLGEKEFRSMSETERVVALIKELECWRLGSWDGCCCSRFSLRNVDVKIRCGKGGDEQAVYVSSVSSDHDDETLKPIMADVIRQVTEQSGRSGEFAQHIDSGHQAGAGIE
ncbi:hypothetical protein X739_00610 [Mesorhizobium sp. LNHC220B00]|nr:hypothetical protein [Mesorhizobium sp. LNHC220B00]ESY89032.1 hypothetical protein X739_00610 [Mesorhizobium sp. LNHC220B00]